VHKNPSRKKAPIKHLVEQKNEFTTEFNGSRFLHEINLNLAIVEETLSMITGKQISSPINSVNHHLIFEIPEEHNNNN